MDLTATREGIAIALESLRANKARTGLTVLGIVIGVFTSMTMAAAIGGLRSTVQEQVNSMGPENFTVTRFDQLAIQVDDGTGKPPWEGKPPITFEEAALLSGLPAVRTAVTALGANGDVRAGSNVSSGTSVMGRGALWPEFDHGNFVRGRNFLPDDEARGAPVAVISEEVSRILFGERDPVGERVRVNREQLTVVGVYAPADNLFQAGAPKFVITPTTTLHRRLGIDADFLNVLVVTAPSATQDEAIEQVTAALRTSRGLRPGAENDFAITRPEEIAGTLDQAMFVLGGVMLLLASVGLMVGGVGVVGIMMISVTERTREIGVRKALGATRREILWQFLVESMTVTTIGGGLGILISMAATFLLGATTPIPAVIPWWAVVAALGVAALTGIGFGLYPANKAARLDPVEALRYE